MTLDQRNKASMAGWLMRQSLLMRGRRFPDPRDQALRDRGDVLQWHQGIARRALKPGRKQYRPVGGIGLRMAPPRVPPFLRVVRA